MWSDFRNGRLRAFTGPNAEERAGRCGLWFRAVVLGELDGIKRAKAAGVFTKASATSPNVAGGFLAPVELYDAVINLREQYGVTRRNADRAPMKSDVLMYPRRTGGVTTYFIAENSAIVESQITGDDVGLTAKKIAALVKLSTESYEDSELGELVANEIAYAFAKQEDLCAFNGDGTSAYGRMHGLTQVLADGNHAGGVKAQSGHNTFPQIDSTDLASLIGAVPAIALPGAKWFCSVYAYANVFARLTGVAGGHVSVTLGGAQNRPTYLGFPVEPTQVMPSTSGSLSSQVMIAFGDMSLAVTLGDRRRDNIVLSTDRFLDNDQVVIRGTERFDVVCHDLGSATAAGPLVGLIGN